MSKVSVLGAGSWGIALGLSAWRSGSDVMLWSKFPEDAERIKKDRENKKRLPGILLPSQIQISADIKEACASNILVLATPAQTIREVCACIASLVQENAYLIIAAKGIEVSTHLLMSEIVSELIPQAGVAVLSGPSFADEVARGLPTAITLAAQNIQTATYLGAAFNSDSFRVYASDDIIGVQLGGALKNVLAIGTGMIRSLGLGANAEAALITRGIVEISRLACALGAKPATLHGLSGLGDIVLTCSHEKSRNMFLGMEIGKGKTPAQVVSETAKTFEGLATSKSISALATAAGVEMPICGMIDKILNQEVAVKEAIIFLMNRSMKPEVEDH